ncbi:hypothetical protein [Planococcus sp. S3-L1]|uniref:hypothetical protein n=1 Tax=Planococcus sp. S3-L1 TaxID=3046200 RepID=UPI0024BACEBF|nr:hypothetical protein [Planococcus sp. S3-L1]MDJ0331607.1 hypothetical protein [Planococcus sp. S3-L1]
MKKMLKTSGQLIIGALVGFFGMLVLLEDDFRIDLSGYAFIGNIALLAIAALLTLLTISRVLISQNHPNEYKKRHLSCRL